MMKVQVNLTVIAVLGVLLLIAGVWVGSNYFPRPTMVVQGPGPVEKPKLLEIYGTISSIEGSKISLVVGDEERTILINGDTKLSSVVNKSATNFAEEMTRYTKNPERDPAAVPKPFEEKEIEVGDLRKGDLLIVRSNDDIRDKNEFTASFITRTTAETSGEIVDDGYIADAPAP